MCQVKRIKPKYSEDVELGCVHTQMEIWTHNSAVDKPKFMGRPKDQPWWKLVRQNHFLVARIILT